MSEGLAPFIGTGIDQQLSNTHSLVRASCRPMLFTVMVYKYTEQSEIRCNLSRGDWEETQRNDNINNTGSTHSQEHSYL